MREELKGGSSYTTLTSREIDRCLPTYCIANHLHQAVYADEE